MNKQEQQILLDDHSWLPSRPADPSLAAVEAALFIERTFGIALSDDEICPETLGSPEAIESFVLGRLTET
jgi:hypothetical protein